MTNSDLGKLVVKAREGDKEAFAKIYAYFAHNIYYFALKMVENEQDASEISQETMLTLYQNLSNLKYPEAANSFVNKTAYNLCLMSLRKNKDVLVGDEYLENFEADDEFLPEHLVETKESRGKVLEILQQLPEPQKSAILLYYFDDHSTKEIAEILDITEQAVKGRLFRGRETIKSLVKSSGLKGVLSIATANLVLSKILALESKAAFDSTLQNNNWELLASHIGYSAAEISATANIASGWTAKSVSGTAIGTGKVSATVTTAPKVLVSAAVKGTIATILATGLTVGGIFFAQSSGKDKHVSAEVLSASVTPVQVEILGDEVSFEITHNTTSAEADNGTENRSEATGVSASNETSYGIVIDEAVNIPTFSETEITEEVVSSEVHREEQKENSDSTKSSDKHPAAFLARENFKPAQFPVGSTISIQNIADSAGISVVENSTLVATFYETIDTTVEGEYIVYFSATKEQRSSNTIIVIVKIGGN